MKYKSILFCSADPTKNAGGLSDYFIENSTVFTAFHFFPSYTKEKTYAVQYINGKKKFKKTFTFYEGNNLLLKNLFDFCYFSYTIIFIVPRGSFVITNAPVYCFLNFLFRFLKSVKYVLWIGDYYPDKSIKMKIYNIYVSYLNKTVDYVLYLSPPLEQIYSKSRSDNKLKELVPLGIKKQRGKLRKKGKVTVLGFIGIIRRQQGLDLMFEYLKNANDVRFEIVGNGYELPYYKDLARKMGISDKVKFYGKVENVRGVFEGWDIGVALYVNSQANLSKYCEPTKIKDYMSYSLPVITTKTTYLYKEIISFKAGEVVEEDINSLSNAVKKISGNYDAYAEGVQRITERYEYENWYNDKLSFIK